MTTPAALVKRIRQIEANRDLSRREHAAARAEAIRELRELIGADEAARLLGVSRTAIYKAR